MTFVSSWSIAMTEIDIHLTGEPPGFPNAERITRKLSTRGASKNGNGNAQKKREVERSL